MPQVTTQVIAPRKFGVEIEVYGCSRDLVQGALDRGGLSVVSLNQHRSSGTTWRIVNDSSISPSGFEVVSPILQGEDGIAEVRKVCKILVECGARVNRTTGLHVHTDARDLTIDECKNVARRYTDHVAILDSFFPSSRRQGGTHGGGNVSTEELNSIRTKEGADCVHRYRKVNLAALCRHGTLEFRQHSGTINADKVEHWIRFCVAFVEASRAVPSATQTSVGGPARRRLPKKVQIHRLCAWIIEGFEVGFNRSDNVAAAATFLGITPGSAETYLSLLRHAVNLHAIGWSRRGRCPDRNEYQRWYQAQEASLQETGVQTRVTHEVYGPRLIEKLRKIAALIARGGRVSFSTLALAIGVSTHSIPGYIARLRKLTGTKLFCSRDRETVCYRYQRYSPMSFSNFAQGTETPAQLAEALRSCATRRPNAAATPTVATPGTLPTQDTWDRGLPREVVSFYMERAADLNGGNLPEAIQNPRVVSLVPPPAPRYPGSFATPGSFIQPPGVEATFHA